MIRLIDGRLRCRQPITAEWIDEAIVNRTTEHETAELDRLLARLEVNIEEFGQTSTAARSATSEYHHALASQAAELRTAPAPEAMLSELARITKAMLRRTRDIELAMQRSEAQTRQLKVKLDETKRSAEEDQLTGLPNRRAFEARYASEYRAARGVGEALTVAFCDLDHFKAINDTHGHAAGDRVLRLFARNLARISNDRCHVARHGGEEFVVLFRDLSPAGALAALDALRAELAARCLVNRATDTPIGQVTFSGGVADVFAYPDRSAALRAADAALYRAKQLGRNRLELATVDDGQDQGVGHGLSRNTT